jgi:hypothetical protein
LAINNYGMKFGCWDIMDASCDLCATNFFTPKIMLAGNSFTLTLKDSPEYSTVGQKFELVPPYTYNDLARELNESGWTSEVIHGKQLILCPTCSAK